MGFSTDQKHINQPSLVISVVEAHLRKPQAPAAGAINSLDHFIACLTACFVVGPDGSCLMTC